jgi:nucleotide-binding universal stress UspA family protein
MKAFQHESQPVPTHPRNTVIQKDFVKLQSGHGFALCPLEAIMDLKRILVAVNSANGRDAAFDRALRLAQSSGAELYVLHAVRANQPFSFNAAGRLERLADLRQRAADAGVRVHTAEQHGDPAEIIELHSNARGVDLIVMGGEARRGWGQRSLVAESVIRRTSVPTLIVTGDESGPAAFQNVLVAIDLSPASKDVLSSAVELTAAEAVQLTVMHTVKALEAADALQSPARWTVPEYRTHVLKDAQRAMEAVVSAVPGGLDTQVQLATGSATRTILQHAAEVDADLVVVGRSRGFKILGSTALRVLRKNDRALLVVPSASQRAARVERRRAA